MYLAVRRPRYEEVEKANARGEREAKEAQRRSGAAAQRRNGAAAQRRASADHLPFESLSPLYVTNRFRFVELRNPSERARASLLVVHVADVCCLLSAAACWNTTDGGAADQARALRLAPANARLGRTAVPRLVLLWIIFFVHWWERRGGALCSVPDLRLILG